MPTATPVPEHPGFIDRQLEHVFASGGQLDLLGCTSLTSGLRVGPDRTYEMRPVQKEDVLA